MGTVTYTVIDGEVVSENRGGTQSFYVPDPLGSTVALLDNTQAKTDTFGYWPYGENNGRTGTTPTPFQFVGTAGYYRDSASRAHVRARTLNTALGRWITEDPIFNMRQRPAAYVYADLRPTTVLDFFGLTPPTGHAPGGPWHPPIGVKTACRKGDDCNTILRKMWILHKMLRSHIGWVAKHPGDTIHPSDIAQLWVEWNACQDLALKTCGFKPPYLPDPIRIPDPDGCKDKTWPRPKPIIELVRYKPHPVPVYPLVPTLIVVGVVACVLIPGCIEVVAGGEVIVAAGAALL